MKRFALALASVGVAFAAVGAETKPVLKDQNEKAAYVIGVSLAKQWKQRGMDPNLDLVVKGIKDGYGNGETLLTEKEMGDVWKSYQDDLRAKYEEKRKVEAEKNKAAGTKFLAENKTKPGVITLPSGLQYKIISEGTGPVPKSSDNVEVNYRGTLLDGTEFDSSYKKGKPASFAVFGVIKGWSEALQLMKVGSKWELAIPADLAYGDRGMGQNIPPGSVLKFEVELLSIKPQVNPPAPPTVTSDIIKVPSQEELKKGAQIEIIKAPKEGEKPAAK